MGLSLDVTIPALTVFLQGILSFFSPCVLPIIPLYIGYLSGGTTSVDEKGEKVYDQKVIMMHTFFFIVGVSFAFFLLGMGFSTLGRYFASNQMLFSRMGGIIIIFLGLMQWGVFDKPFRGKEFKLPIKTDHLRMNPFTALIMGFTFSFAWTPCVGPALSTVLIMISSASTTIKGIMLMGVYTVGFTLPFLFVGIFTTKCLNYFKKYRNVVSYTIRIGAVLMILMGLMMFTGTMNGITGYLSTLGINTQVETIQEETTQVETTQVETTQEETTQEQTTQVETTQEQTTEEETQEESSAIPAIDFELEDQFGVIHKLSDYKGKVIFLNFWATWCPPCVAEMPEIQLLYEEYGYNEDEVIVLGVASPNDENSYTQEKSKDYVINFLAENEYTYPTVMDVTGVLGYSYGISAYPTTFMIDVEGNVFGYVSGMLSYDIMENIVEQTINQERE